MPIDFYHPSYGEAIRGQCWRAEHKDAIVPCKLTFQRDGRCEVTLDEGGTELLSLYTDEHAPFHAEVLHLRPTPVTVFGQVSIGDAAVGIGTEDMRGWHRGHIQVDELLYGIHITDRSAPLVTRVTFHTDRIHDIFRLEGLRIGPRPNGKVKLRFTPPQIDLVRLDNNVVLKLDCHIRHGWQIMPPEEVTFKQYTRLELRYDGPACLDECKKHIARTSYP
jgi:ApeA N-terminal domain 1